jgi:hypothetical protein
MAIRDKRQIKVMGATPSSIHSICARVHPPELCTANPPHMAFQKTTLYKEHLVEHSPNLLHPPTFGIHIKETISTKISDS